MSPEVQDEYRLVIPNGSVKVRYRKDRVGGWIAWAILEAGGVTLRGRDYWAENRLAATVKAGEDARAVVSALGGDNVETSQ